uniref:Ycf54 n=1 Tax=Thuretia quercifolia TaxID=189650 RepID=A0A1Z1MKR0_9FLOR|nr:hypothetical protein [Thuretia quercifolia]ARW66331.1 hypothetical protein [Thuretia quercifolia]
MYNYYFALASKNFFLNEEPVEEILRERTQYYQSKNKKIDFWFVLNPSFIDFSELNMSYINYGASYAAIISLDKKFIQWFKLRVGFVTIGEFQSNSLFIPPA